MCLNIGFCVVMCSFHISVVLLRQMNKYPPFEIESEQQREMKNLNDVRFVPATFQMAKIFFPFLLFAYHVPFARNEYRPLQILFNPNFYLLHKVNVSQKLDKKLKKKKKIINAHRQQSLIRNYVLFKLPQDTKFSQPH